MPEISLPDIKLPDVRFRDGRLRDVKLPDIDLRDRLPDVDLSKLSLPGALRDLSMPEIGLRNVHLPHVSMPDVASVLGDARAPAVDLSGVDLRSLDPRRLDLSGLDPKRLRALAPFAKPAPRPSSPLPWVFLAGIAGLFAGWWLATSSMTGPAVRGFAERIRSRVDEWRSGGSEWDEAEERTEGFWSSEQGWQQEGSHPGRGPMPPASGTDGGVSASDATAWEGSTSAAAMGSDAGSDSGPDEGIGGAGYEPPAGDFGREAGAREG